MSKITTIYIICLFFILIGGSTLAFVSFNSENEKNKEVIVKITDIIEVVWPLENVNLVENQVFTARVAWVDVSKFRMFWEVEEGVLGGEMKNDGKINFSSEVDTSKWDWKKDNKYTLRFFVKDENDTLVAETAFFVYVGDTTDSVDQVLTKAFTLENKEVTQTATVYQPTVNKKPPEIAKSSPAGSFTVEWVMSDIKNSQKFIYQLSGYNEDEVMAYWSSEGGHKNLIYKTDNQTPFTAMINIFGWRWKDKGPYAISFTIADKKTSNVIGASNFEMYWQGEPGNSKIQLNNTSNITLPLVFSATATGTALTTTSTLTATTTTVATTTAAVPTPAVATTKLTAKNPAIVSSANNENINTFTKNKLFTPNKPAVEQSLKKLSKPSDIEAIKFILKQPSSVWLNGDAYESDAFIHEILKKAKESNQIPTLVLYNIPNRDCGSYSSGGTDTIENYKAWIDRLAKNLFQAEAIIIIEPDALAQLNCLPEKDRAGRVEMLKYAVETIEPTSPHVMVYMDAGHPFWVNAEEMADRLRQVGIASARGFALNVSNYVSTSDNITYGNYLSNLLGGKKYVIDTSRNGKGPSSTREWCNPAGRSLGEAPAIIQRKNDPLDATLWIKFPGESDGTCNGGPNAGGFWTQYAIDLYKNR